MNPSIERASSLKKNSLTLGFTEMIVYSIQITSEMRETTLTNYLNPACFNYKIPVTGNLTCSLMH